MKKLFASIIVGIIGAGIASAGEYPDISIKELNKAIGDKNVTVLDVNGSASFQKGHVPGAIDFTASKKQIEKLLPKEKDALIVAYCGGPSCNAYTAAAKAAKDLGYTNIKHLSAGISGWKSAGQKLETVAAKGDKKKDGKKKKNKEKKES